MAISTGLLGMEKRPDLSGRVGRAGTGGGWGGGAGGCAVDRTGVACATGVGMVSSGGFGVGAAGAGGVSVAASRVGQWATAWSGRGCGQGCGWVASGVASGWAVLDGAEGDVVLGVGVQRGGYGELALEQVADQGDAGATTDQDDRGELVGGGLGGSEARGAWRRGCPAGPV